MLWGFIVVIKMDGKDGSQLPMVTNGWFKVKKRRYPMLLRVKSDLLRSASLGEGRAVTSGSSYL